MFHSIAAHPHTNNTGIAYKFDLALAAIAVHTFLAALPIVAIAASRWKVTYYIRSISELANYSQLILRLSECILLWSENCQPL